VIVGGALAGGGTCDLAALVRVTAQNHASMLSFIDFIFSYSRFKHFNLKKR
jgi:hypothetical protein